MSGVFVFSRRVALAGLVAASALLAGCATYPDSYYYQDRYADDRYSGGDYYYGRDHDRGYYRDYGYWPGGIYSSVLWPAYYHYYDPWHRSGFYYGVTYFPRDWYGFSFGFNHYDRWSHYHHYSPYRYSWSDNHYNWYGGAGWRHGYRDAYSGSRFGSARNEAERLSRVTGADRTARAYRNDAGNAGYEDVSLGTTTRGFGVPVDRNALPHQGEPQRGNYSREIDNGSRGGYDTRRNEAGRAPEARYERGESGWVSGMPARSARDAGWSRDRADNAAPMGDAAPQYQSLRQAGPAYKPGNQAPEHQEHYENYSRGRDAGGGGLQAQPIRSIEPPRPQYQSPAPRDSGSFTRSADSGGRDSSPSRSDSGNWSRDRDESAD